MYLYKHFIKTHIIHILFKEFIITRDCDIYFDVSRTFKHIKIYCNSKHKPKLFRMLQALTRNILLSPLS